MGWKALFGGFDALAGNLSGAAPKPIPAAQLKAMPNYLAPLTLEDVEERIAQSTRPKVIAQQLESVREHIRSAHSVAQLLLASPGKDRHGEERIIALLEGVGDSSSNASKAGLIRMARVFEQYGRFDLVKRTNDCIEMLVYRLIARSELSGVMRMSERSLAEVSADLALATKLYREQLLPVYKPLVEASGTTRP